MYKFNDFIWETHGVHAGTNNDHVKHGVDNLDDICEKAIKLGHPSVAFIIHSPRLTNIRYESERDTDIKFIRGNQAYLNYAAEIKRLREKYSDKLIIKYGVELEWLGSEIGLQWNRSQLIQAGDIDFAIGSVHFSREGLPYDGSKDEANKLLKIRGNLENYWSGYLDEVIEMIECSSDMFQVIGHIDLPKLNMDIPDPIINFESSSTILADKMRWLLELISQKNLALDVNLAGIKKGCGVYPFQGILRRANSLHIPITIGTDAHHIDHYEAYYEEGLKYINNCGYKQYVSFSRLIPETRTIFDNHKLKVKYNQLNTTIEFLNQRFKGEEIRRSIPDFAFGKSFVGFLDIYPNSTSLGDYDAIRISKENKSITIGDFPQGLLGNEKTGLLSVHLDKPGVLSSLFSTLASERINIETAMLKSRNDGTAVAFLTYHDPEDRITEAIEFLKGTKNDIFLEINHKTRFIPHNNLAKKKSILAVDGVKLELALGEKMILTKHKNEPGVLLILLSALAFYNINVTNLQLAFKNKMAYSILEVDGENSKIENAISNLGSHFVEASFINLFKGNL